MNPPHLIGRGSTERTIAILDEGRKNLRYRQHEERSQAEYASGSSGDLGGGVPTAAEFTRAYLPTYSNMIMP